MNLSFAGCGFLGIYHVGVACCFRKYAPHLLLNKISGASAGAIAACCLLLDLPIGETTSDVLRVAIAARKRSLGPFHPTFDINKLILEGLEKYLPEDAHIRVSGKLHVSLTHAWSGQNVIISEFKSREELIQVLLASAFIPLFSGVIPPKFRDNRYFDGGCSDNLPTLDENTITVSPFCGESDICPRDGSSQLLHINVANTSIELSKRNMYRVYRIFFPPTPEVLANMCKQGFDDALRFLHRNNLISCTRCLAVQSTFVVADTLDDSLEYDPQCEECRQHRQEAYGSNMPETVLKVFQEAIDATNKGVLNWLFKHRGMRLLSLLTLPYTLPADIMLATIIKCVASAPQMGNSLLDVSKFCLAQLSHLLTKANQKRQQISAKVICRLAVTEYDGTDVEAFQDELALQNRMNLNFTVNFKDSDMPINQSPRRKFATANILKRRPSLTITRTETGDEDTFEHILEVTSQHDTIMAYYYLENNKVKVTEIFDVSDSESPVVQTETEQELNRHLEFDDDWEEPTWTTNHASNERVYSDERRGSLEETSEDSLEDILDQDASNLFSDPESEWTENYTVEEPEDHFTAATDLRPESEQPYLRTTTIPAFTFQDS